MKRKAYMVPNPQTPNRAIDFDPVICNGCNRCVRSRMQPAGSYNDAASAESERLRGLEAQNNR